MSVHCPDKATCDRLTYTQLMLTGGQNRFKYNHMFSSQEVSDSTMMWRMASKVLNTTNAGHTATVTARWTTTLKTVLSWPLTQALTPQLNPTIAIYKLLLILHANNHSFVPAHLTAQCRCATNSIMTSSPETAPCKIRPHLLSHRLQETWSWSVHLPTPD